MYATSTQLSLVDYAISSWVTLQHTVNTNQCCGNDRGQAAVSDGSTRGSDHQPVFKPQSEYHYLQALQRKSRNVWRVAWVMLCLLCPQNAFFAQEDCQVYHTHTLALVFIEVSWWCRWQSPGHCIWASNTTYIRLVVSCVYHLCLFITETTPVRPPNPDIHKQRSMTKESFYHIHVSPSGRQPTLVKVM